MKQKLPKKSDLTTYDYSKITKNSDNTENMGRETTNMLVSQHTPRYRNDITSTNKTLITGRSQSPHFDINDQSIFSMKRPENYSNKRQNNISEEEQKDESCIVNIPRKAQHKKKSESVNNGPSQIKKSANGEDITKSNNIRGNVIDIEEFQENENIKNNETFENHIINNKLAVEYHKTSKQMQIDLDKKVNICEANEKNPIPNISLEQDITDKIEAKLRMPLSVRSKKIIPPSQLGDIEIVCDQESQIEEQQEIIELSIKESDRSSTTCLICFDKQSDAVLMDCGHGGFSL